MSYLDRLAKAFHETCRRMAPRFGLRRKMAPFDPDSSAGRLLISVVEAHFGASAPGVRLRFTSGEATVEHPLQTDPGSWGVFFADVPIEHDAPGTINAVAVSWPAMFGGAREVPFPADDASKPVRQGEVVRVKVMVVLADDALRADLEAGV